MNRIISIIIAGLSLLIVTICPGYTQQIDSPENIAFEEQTKETLIGFENQYVKFALNRNGSVESFFDKARNIDYCANPGKYAFLSAIKGKQTYTPSSLSFVNQQLTVKFESLQLTAVLEIKVFDNFLTVELLDISSKAIDTFILANLNLSITTNVAKKLNACYDDNFAVAIIALDPRVECMPVTRRIRGILLRAKSYTNYGLVGSKVAIIGCPLREFKSVIKEVEILHNLPHPRLNGTWAKDSLEVKKSYLFMDVTEKNVDRVIKYAKAGGFGQILIYVNVWSAGAGHYPYHPKNYPNGEVGLKRVVDKIHKAGLRVGIHTLTATISPQDVYLSPKPDKRLAKDYTSVLADSINAQASFIPTKETPIGFPIEYDILKSKKMGVTIQIDDEIIAYKGISTTVPYGFTDCIRGLYKTVATNHNVGAMIYHLQKPRGSYILDAETTLLDEVSQRITEVMNNCEFDMIYLDNSWRVQSPQWYYTTKVQMAIYNQLDQQDTLVQGSGYTLYTWHAFARYTSSDTYRSFPHYLKEDLKRKPSKEHLDRIRIKNIISYKRNLMPAELGWFGLFKDTTPDEIEYLCCKAAGYDIPISIETRADYLDSNPRTWEMLSIIKNYETLRLENYFTEKEKAKLREPGKEYRLVQKSEERWALVPVEYEPERVVSITDGKDNIWTIVNNGSRQPIELELKMGESRTSKRLQGMQNPTITVEKQTLTFPTILNQNDLLVFKSMDDCKVYRVDGSIEDLTPVGNPPILKVGENQVIFSWGQTECKHQVGVRIIKVYWDEQIECERSLH